MSFVDSFSATHRLATALGLQSVHDLAQRTPRRLLNVIMTRTCPTRPGQARCGGQETAVRSGWKIFLSRTVGGFVLPRRDPATSGGPMAGYFARSTAAVG